MTFNFFKNKLARTQKTILSGFQSALGSKTVNESIEVIEETLITADMGVDSSTFIADKLRDSLGSGVEGLEVRLKEILLEILAPVDKRLVIEGRPFIIMVVGVNGVGKTTTIGKLTSKFSAEGKSVLLGACDTFRAAATEQLTIWASITNSEIVTGGHGANPSGVAYEAVKKAIEKGVDVAIIDTAGRLHTDENLLEELKKIDRVIKKAFTDSGVDPLPSIERLLIIDGTTGQNGLTQAKAFNSAVNLTGIIITKLDGTAKGGLLIPLARELSTAIRFVGIGEKAEDLQVFNSSDYVEGLIKLDSTVDN